MTTILTLLTGCVPSTGTSNSASKQLPADSTVPIVAASPTGGLFNAIQTVTLSANEGATIYYTTNGSAPTIASSVYSSPLTILTSTTLKFFAKDTVGNSSGVTTAIYSIDTAAPTVSCSPAGGSFTSTKTVTLTANESATIYYTLDGSNPTTAASVYSAPLTIDSSRTLKYFARDSVGNSNGIATQIYTIDASLAIPISQITVSEKQGVSSTNYPLTFGMVFKEGDVPQTVRLKVGGTPLSTQVDIKTRWSDGSVRHAVISALIPSIGIGASVPVTIETAATSASTGEMTKGDMLTTDIGATINLTGLSDSGYSGNLTADLRATLNADGPLNYWLKGGVTTEILLNQRLNNSLNANWEVRFYPGTPYIRISHSIENIESLYRGNINYAVAINQGNTTPAQVYSKATFQHNRQSRWRKVLWLGAAPPEVEIHYDLPYLISTGHIPKYDTSVVVSNVNSTYSNWLTKDRDIMGYGYLVKDFGTTGGRDEIGLLPAWTVRYLLTWSNKMREVMLNHADVTAGCPSHYRESNPAKSFYGRVLSIDDRPTVWTDESQVNSGNVADRLPAAIGTVTTQWRVDRAHQASFDYIPYLITGDRFYLDELYYWSAYNMSSQDSNASWGRNNALGIFRGEVRAQAWSLRTLAHTVIMSPDGPEKTYFANKLQNNLTYYQSVSTTYPLRYWGVDSYATKDNMTADVKYVTNSWMHDFVMIVLSHMRSMGIDTTALLSEHSKFTIGRFTAPDFNPYNGAPYRFPAVYTDSSYPLTWAQANASFVTQGSSYSSDPEGYASVSMAALAGMQDLPNADNAYSWLESHTTINHNASPQWSIVP